MPNLCDICEEPMKDSGYKAYDYELCPALLQAKSFFLMHLMQNCKSCLNSIQVLMSNVKNASKNKAELANLVTKDDFIEQKIKAVAILPSTAIYPQRLFCRELFVIGQS